MQVGSSLYQIAETLVIHGTFVNDPGLWHGKMGIAVFFFHYAQHTGNEVYEDYAIYLIDELQKQLHTTMPVGYSRGMAGIGVGFEYLMQHQFLEADADDILGDFDDRMYRAAMYEPYPGLSLAEGLTGWGRYFIYRLCGSTPSGNTQKLKEALEHTVCGIKEKLQNGTVNETEQMDIYGFSKELQYLPTHAGVSLKVRNTSTIKRNTVTPGTFPESDMSLRQGLAGEGLHLLSTIGYPDDSWKQLL